jgi:hypothetical protein
MFLLRRDASGMSSHDRAWGPAERVRDASSRPALPLKSSSFISITTAFDPQLDYCMAGKFVHHDSKLRQRASLSSGSFSVPPPESDTNRIAFQQ